MESFAYLLVRSILALLQALPIRVVARLGRLGGALAYRLDGRHRRVALKNLTLCFGSEKSEDWIRALAKENFRRIGENFACAAKTASMDLDQLRGHLSMIGASKLPPWNEGNSRTVIVAIGHFGNFELYARMGQFIRYYRAATTYRGLPQPALDRLLRDLRQRADCLFFERRTQGAQLKAALKKGNIVLGLLADQNAGQSGYRLSFMGHDCSTTLAPAVFALRYGAPLFTAFCNRIGLAKWQLELGDEIPTHESGHARSAVAIMNDVHRSFESVVRRDPANWFWVHNRWKAPGREPKSTHDDPMQALSVEE